MVYVDKFNEDIGDLMSGSRVCKVCLERLPMAEFFWTNGRKGRRRKCRECLNVQRRERLSDPLYRATYSEYARYKACLLYTSDAADE